MGSQRSGRLSHDKMRNYVSFIYELINIGILKQQFGTNIIEQFYKKRKDPELNIILKSIYLDADIILFDTNKLIAILANFSFS